MPENVVSAEKLNERLVANPFNAWMGLRILDLTEETIEIGLEWREDMVSNPKARVTHGGILGALIDVAGDFMIAAKVGAPVPTVDLRVDYHRAAGIDQFGRRSPCLRRRRAADRERARRLFHRGGQGLTDDRPNHCPIIARSMDQSPPLV